MSVLPLAENTFTIDLEISGFMCMIGPMDLYHVDIKLPTGFVKPTGRVALNWTRHAEQARENDRYGRIPAFRTATLNNLQVIEVGVEGSRVVKILFRGYFSGNFDMCMVLIPNGERPWTVKTVWLNDRTDTHKTLDRSKYVC